MSTDDNNNIYEDLEFTDGKLRHVSTCTVDRVERERRIKLLQDRGCAQLGTKCPITVRSTL